VAVGKQPPIQASLTASLQSVLANGRRTVLGQRVVPSRMIREAVDFIQIVNQQNRACDGGICIR